MKETFKSSCLQWQQQQFADGSQNRCSEKVRNICMKAAMFEPLFNKHFYKEIAAQMFSCKYCKIFKNSFFTEHLLWLLLQVLQKKDAPKNFANFNIMYRYRSPFLSSCRPLTCNFKKTGGPVQLFCCKFCEISQNNFMQNKFERLHLDVKRCCEK